FQTPAPARLDGFIPVGGGIVVRLRRLRRALPADALAQGARLRGGVVMNDQLIIFEDVSKFYGEILGVNRVNLTIAPGITSLVGPNGSGKTTLMNLMTGLIQPTRGRMSVLGVSPQHPEELFRHVGYCSQFDSFPKGLTGYEFIRSLLAVHGLTPKEAEEKKWRGVAR